MQPSTNSVILSDSKSFSPLIPVGVTAIGYYLPETVYFNNQIYNVDEKFEQIHGIRQRHVAGEETLADMAVKACINMFENFKINPLNVDLIILVHSYTQSETLPGPVYEIQTRIGANNAYAFSVDGGFNGFIPAVSTAVAYISSGMFNTILVVASEDLVGHISTNRTESLFMGDGAGAILLEKVKEGGVLACHGMSKWCKSSAGVKLETDINIRNKTAINQLYIYTTPNSFEENFSYLVKQVPYSVKKCLTQANIKKEEVDYYIFGQLTKILENAWQVELQINNNQIISCLKETACMENANIPVQMAMAWKEGKFKTGDVISIADQSANWSIASILVKWNI